MRPGAFWVALLSGGLAAVLLMGAGYRGTSSTNPRYAAVSHGYLYWDSMRPAAYDTVYVQNDSLAVKRGGQFMPVARVDVIYFGAGTDSLMLQYCWGSPLARTDSLKVICNATTLNVFPPLLMRADFVRVKPLAGSDASDWLLIAGHSR